MKVIVYLGYLAGDTTFKSYEEVNLKGKKDLWISIGSVLRLNGGEEEDDMVQDFLNWKRKCENVRDIWQKDIKK